VLGGFMVIKKKIDSCMGQCKFGQSKRANLSNNVKEKLAYIFLKKKRKKKEKRKKKKN
jgi:hypothetical protein